MTLFDDSNAHDSSTATLTEQQPPTDTQTEQAATAAEAQAHEAEASEASAPEALGPEAHAEEQKPVDDFASALESFTSEAEETAGEDNVIHGTVLKVTGTYVFVDIGAKSEGAVPIAEVLDHEGKPKFQAGDAIDVMRDKGKTDEGYINLSYQKAQRLRAWDDIEKAYSENQPIKATVVERTKGGVTVDINGARAFMPGSQLDLRPVRNLEAYKGQSFDVAIVKLNKKRGNIVVSRKQLLEQEQNAKKSQLLEHLQEGSILTGVVKNLTDYGAFVDLGGIDGLLHITDMSWGRLTHPRDLVNVGDQIQVKVLKFDGDIHVSEMTWSKRMKHPSKLVNVHDEVDCVVLSVNPTERRISLGMRQLAANPWDSLIEKYPVGASVEGRVRNLTDFGAFIEIEEGIDGLVHVSNLSWTKRVKHPSEVLKKGDRVKAVVLAIDSEKRRLSLGVKQLQPDVWEAFFQAHHIGDVVHGKVLRVAAFGSFVEIAEGVEGLCHNSEAVDGNGQPMHLEPGNEHDFKIIKMSPEEKKVGLSIRAAGEEASRTEVESYKHPASSTGSTIGELMNWKRENA